MNVITGEDAWRRAMNVITGEEMERAWGCGHWSGEFPGVLNRRGHTVVGVLRSGVIGVRHYDVQESDRIRLGRALLVSLRLRGIVFFDIVDEPACVAHEDCELSDELGRACWAEAHSPARAGE